MDARQRRPGGVPCLDDRDGAKSEDVGVPARNVTPLTLACVVLLLRNPNRRALALEMDVRSEQNDCFGNAFDCQGTENRNGSRTYHWVQEEPIPNYLLALNVGEFVEVPLADAEVGQRKVPLSIWTHTGDEESAAFLGRGRF